MRRFLTLVAITGDVLYVLWILYNGLDEGFKYILKIQGIVPLVLVALLIVNVVLLYGRD